MAFAYEPDPAAESITPETAPSLMREMIQGMILERQINPWCAICSSREFLYEDGVTRFKSIEEAKPALKELQEMNRRSRELIDAAKMKATHN